MSERIKAQMLDEMLQTAIVEHKTLHGHGMDLFACYFKKTELGSLKELCVVHPETIAKLLKISLKFGYVWQTKVLRLELLDSMDLLNEEQRQEYAKLIWTFLGENGLPNMYLFPFEKMSCIDACIPARSVKGWFLSQSVAAQFEDEQGCKLSLQKIPYLDELILVCDNMEREYWSSEEADCLLLLAEMLYKNTENRLLFKDILHARKACVSIAFQMLQLIGATEDYAGVRRWEEIAIDSEEMNEIKDEWVFK